MFNAIILVTIYLAVVEGCKLLALVCLKFAFVDLFYDYRWFVWDIANHKICFVTTGCFCGILQTIKLIFCSISQCTMHKVFCWSGFLKVGTDRISNRCMLNNPFQRNDSSKHTKYSEDYFNCHRTLLYLLL